MILYCGKLIATNPELFHGILVLRSPVSHWTAFLDIQ
jgi:hypothetical protein